MNKNNEDYMIEEFWISFKKSMLNFYNEINILSRPIILWSNKLNELQKNKEYMLIESNIRDYMSLYAIDLLRHNAGYHINILISNIKRWNTIAKNNSKFDIKSDSKYINSVFLLIDLYNIINVKMPNIENDLISLFSMVELYIIHEDFKAFIDYALIHNKPCIIDKINEFETPNGNFNKSNTIKYIEDKYKVLLSPKMSAKKIFQIIKT